MAIRVPRRVPDTEVLIAGGGIIGLSTALELAGRGMSVTVVERGRAMREASWAAAGMLAAHDPENPPALQPLSELSLRLYPDFLRRIEELSGLRIPLRSSRTLQTMHTGECHWLNEHSLDPRDLCAALPGAVRAAGVTLVEETSVLAANVTGSGIRIETGSAAYSARQFLQCCGAWAGEWESLPVGPSKGQMVMVRLMKDKAPAHVIRTPEIYLVPRGDGTVVIGATVERAGFDKSVQPSSLRSLMDKAAALWPAAASAEIVDAWAGLRPESEDGLPLIGAYAERCWTAAGHFRNGILLAPATAHLLAQMLCGERPTVDFMPFRCDRFALPNVHSSEAAHK